MIRISGSSSGRFKEDRTRVSVAAWDRRSYRLRWVVKMVLPRPMLRAIAEKNR
jgi:hypothetical protein